MFGSLSFSNWKFMFYKEYFIYNEKEMNFFLVLLFMSLLMSVFCYMSIDPMKSCLYLVLSLIFLTPYLSFMNEVWFSYFVCMIFLSGIFVILVYFTSMSKYIFHNLNLSFLVLIGLFFVPFVYLNYSLSLQFIYYSNQILMFIFMLLSLIYFMNFSSYFLNYSGALRKA